MGSRLEKNSELVRKRIQSHTFENEDGEEYGGSKFGGFSDYFRRKKLKLQNLDVEVRSSSLDKPNIFRGIVAHVNGYTQPSLNDLHHLIVSHGGGFMQYLDSKTTVTHIIAANITPKKATEFKRYRIVKPAWVVESVKAGKLLPWDAYRVLDEGPAQRLLGFDDGKMVSQVKTQKRGYRDQMNTSWYASQVKNAAKGIDDDEGKQFFSTQPAAVDGTRGYVVDSFTYPLNSAGSVSLEEKEIAEDSADFSASFEVSSSSEDALRNAKTGNEITQQNLCKKESEPGISLLQCDQPLEFATPKRGGLRGFSNTSSGNAISFDIETPSNPRSLSQDADTPSPSKKGKALTAEEHNALLLADPKIRKSSTANPDFIKQFYSESRLHHLSTWKADLKCRFQAMASEKSASQRPPPKRKLASRRYIMHVDFDSFFCAVSLKGAPEYVDKPTVVAHGNGSGSEIASCNYPARIFGVKNGMWMKKALTLCPNIKVLPYDFPAYEEASQLFYEAILDVGGIVQSVSIDEALVDITALVLALSGTDGLGVHEGSILLEQGKADCIAQRLRTTIKEKTGCVVSIGIGANILLAKVALRKAKPAGQHQIKPEYALDFIGGLGVQDLPGVAGSIGGKLEEIGINFVKDIRKLTKDRLMTVLGPKTGEKIWDYSRGIDRTEVGEQVVRKSVSAEVNWGIRFISQSEAEEFVMNLCKELQRRLVEQRVKGRQLTMKIMKRAADAPLDPPKHLGHGKCDTYNKSIILGVATNNAETIGREAISIVRNYGFSPGELRGLGVQMQKLEPLNVALPDGRQRRISFGIFAAPKVVNQHTEDLIDDPETPKRPKTTPMSHKYYYTGTKAVEDLVDESITPQKLKSTTSQLLFSNDPIDDIDSPKKSKATPIHPASAIARANASDKSARKLLNLTGTQFIMPTQLDPAVLLELPQDIRSKLMAQSKSRPASRSDSPALRSRSQSPIYRSVAFPSQLDPEVFSALPEEMKAEILASYASNHTDPSRTQSLLPQSPCKLLPLPPRKSAPTKRGRGRPPGSRNVPKQDPHSLLKQSNFVTKKASTPDAFSSKDQDTESESDTLDPEFLSALSENMLTETLNEHRRKRLERKGGLVTAAASKKRTTPEGEPDIQLKLRLPPHEPRPTFTTRELSSLPELRETLSAWYNEFVDDGPHPDDIAAMERYLVRVVLDERDMGKAVGMVKWLAWLIDERGGDNEGTEIWMVAFGGIKEKIQEAVKERGLGRLEL